MELNKLNIYHIMLLILVIIYFIIIFLLFDGRYGPLIDTINILTNETLRNETFPNTFLFDLFVNRLVADIVNVMFTIVAFLIQLILINVINNKTKAKLSPDNIIEGWCALDQWSLFITANVYLVIQVILGLVLIIYGVNLGVALIIQCILLGIFIILELLLVRGIEYIGKVEEKTIENTKFIKDLKTEVEILKNSGVYPEELEELYESVRYSIPLSNPKVKYLENDINNKMSYLASNLIDNPEVPFIIQDIISDLNKRDIILKNK